MLFKLIRNWKVAKEINSPKLTDIEKSFLVYLHNCGNGTYQELIKYLSKHKKTITELDIKQIKSAIGKKCYYDVIDNIDGGYAIKEPKSPFCNVCLYTNLIQAIIWCLVCIFLIANYIPQSQYDKGYKQRIVDVKFCKKNKIDDCN